MKVFSMFSGIGTAEKGIEQAYATIRQIQQVDGDNGFQRDAESHRGRSEPIAVGFAEIDKYATAIYKYHWPHVKNYGDATAIICDELPDFELLVAGFPCQSFSIAGKRQGFNEARGTLFFEIARILSHKRPRHFLLENVKGLLSSDDGKVYTTILRILSDFGYRVETVVLNSKHFGVPQNRERVFFIGHHKDACKGEVLDFTQEEKYARREAENVYELSPNLSENIRTLVFHEKSESPRLICPTEMQTLLECLQQEISSGESCEIEREPENLRQDAEGYLQEAMQLSPRTPCDDFADGLCEVVRIPTSDMLLLWHRGSTSAFSFRSVQQQEFQVDDRPNGQRSAVFKGESGSLLLAMQSHKGRLLFSVGNGTDWQVICSTEMEYKWNPSLSDILEVDVAEKYFLSETSMAKLMQYNERQEANGNGFRWTPKAPDEIQQALKVGGMGVNDTVSVNQ